MTKKSTRILYRPKEDDVEDELLVKYLLNNSSSLSETIRQTLIDHYIYLAACKSANYDSVQLRRFAERSIRQLLQQIDSIVSHSVEHGHYDPANLGHLGFVAQGCLMANRFGMQFPNRSSETPPVAPAAPVPPVAPVASAEVVAVEESIIDPDSNSSEEDDEEDDDDSVIFQSIHACFAEDE